MVRPTSRADTANSKYTQMLMIVLGLGMLLGISNYYTSMTESGVISTEGLKALQDVSEAVDVAELNKNDAVAVTSSNVVSTADVVPPADTAEQKQVLKNHRKTMAGECDAATTVDGWKMAVSKNSDVFTLPGAADIIPLPRSPGKTLKPCQRVMMDFGANIGDTSGHLVDSGMVGCKRPNIEKKTEFFHHFDVASKQFITTKKRNPLTHHIIKLMAEVSKISGTDDLGPENYCYYGVEGNPVFTRRLQDIEDFVMSMKPRPIQHMHFLTESVGAGSDGPTKLYLDTVNTKQNFWGSSIFEGHQDVKKSAEAEGKGEVIAADVMGYTIGTLMRKTLAFFDPDAPASAKVNNHLILKVDIEGGEYPLLHQAAEEGTLCEFVQAGNKADLFIEFHSQKVTGRHELFSRMKGNKEKLTKCGVVFRNLAAFWA